MVKKSNLPNQIIAIGASAGGLEPLQMVMGNLPEKLQNTAIVIAQHTSPDYKSMLVNILAKHSNIDIFEAEDKMTIKGDTIYTIPPDTDAEILNHQFIFNRPSKIGPRPNIDKLFSSIGEEFKEKCIGVILSGTGHDGAKGIVKIKSKRGFVIVQEPETSKYSGMPLSAIKTGVVDLILSPEEVGKELPKLFDVEYRLSKIAESNDILVDNTSLSALNTILNLLQDRKRTDFSGYKTSTIYRRLDKRISDKGFENIQEYADHLEKNKSEVDNLFEYLLIGVTNFFRNPHSFELLRENIKKQLIEKKREGTFRVWIPGCATGEEAYTIGMIVYDLLGETAYPASQVQIFATDIDQKPLKTARIGIYNEESMESIPSYYKKKYFTKDGNEYHIKNLIKKLILFSKHDVTSDPPFLRLDLVSCRNLMIYFKTELQNQIIPLFHYSLNPHGLLFLGKSENIGQFKNLFSTESTTDKIFRSKPTEQRISHIPLLKPLTRPSRASRKKTTTSIKQKSLLERVRDTIFTGFKDAYVVVDDNYNIIEINNDISPFLKLKSGIANLNIIKLAISSLQMELRSVISKAITTTKYTEGHVRKIDVGDKIKFLKIAVHPLSGAPPNQNYFLIIFHTIEIDSQLIASGGKTSEKVENSFIIELEHELATTKEHMNTLVEELETSNEELQSLNEELQSSNEELQASNEELETSNEELQATNEELNVAYSELRLATSQVEQKSEELEKSQDNLQSLLNNTQQAFILIDRDYKIIIFNKTAKVICKDTFGASLQSGNLFIDILPSDYLSDFHKRIKQAFNGKQLNFIDKVVDMNGNDRYLSFNYTPVENDFSRDQLTQVSISFIDVTESKKTEIKLLTAQSETENQRKLWQNLFIDAPQLIAILAGDNYEFQFVNKSYQEVFPKEDLIGKNLIDVLPEMKSLGFVEILNDVRKTNTPHKSSETQISVINQKVKDPQTRYFDFTYYPVIYGNSNKPDIIVYATDVTSQVEARKAIEDSNLFMALVADGLPNHVWVLDADGTPTFVNQQSMDYLGFDYSKTGLKKWINSIHPNDKQETEERLNMALSTGESFEIEHRIKNIKGTYQWFLSQSSPIRDQIGYISKWIGSSTHIHEQKMLNNRKDEFIGIASHELKTPLTSVKAYTELLEDHLKHSEDEEALLYLHKANKNISKLEGFINDLLDVSRIQAGKLKLHKETFNFDTLVKETVESMNHTAMEHTINFEGSSGVVLEADRGRIEQVIINFINNAIKYSPQSFKVWVLVKKTDKHVQLSVIDSGIGIPVNKVDKIFDRFFRIEEQSNHISGLGIGLNICRDIIKMHQGEIGVDSMEGKGSTFYFRLPI